MEINVFVGIDSEQLKYGIKEELENDTLKESTE